MNSSASFFILQWLPAPTSYAVGVLCRFVDNPSHHLWGTAKCLLWYLEGTVDLKLVYSSSHSPDHFTTYLDADLSGNPDNSWSTGGFMLSVGGGAVQWGSRLNSHLSLYCTAS